MDLGFVDPKKEFEFSLPEHKKMVKAGDLDEKELPVFVYKRMTGNDRLSIGDEASTEEIDPVTKVTTVKTRRNTVTLAMVKKYWVGARNFKPNGVDLSFNSAQKNHSEQSGELDKFMADRMGVLPEDFMYWLYLMIHNGSVLEDEEAKNSESRPTVSSDTTQKDSPVSLSVES